MRSDKSWKERLAGKVDAELSREIDIFETQIALRREGRVDEKVFAETRLRRGVYGQRYDNGQRHDGTRTREIPFPEREHTKGPNTKWDAPGMMRLKIPFGRLTPAQLDTLAELSEEYSQGVLHVTTRQDLQLHFVHLEDTPTLMRRLGAVGITTREACGNSVRNVTACPRSGVCSGEAFDTSPYAHALAQFLLGHPDTQDFGRKFKISFSGCREEACGLAAIHDLGLVATIRDGQRGFLAFVGGGLGAVPHQAQELSDFVPERELLPVAQAICRLFARHGQKKNRARARLKFLVAKLGIAEFRRMVAEERRTLVEEPRWTAFLGDLSAGTDAPLRPASESREQPRGSLSTGFRRWRETNVYPQRQPGYAIATVRLPLGDMSANQARGLADLARTFCGDAIRTTVEQNIVLRWVPEADLPKLYEGLRALGLDGAGAGTIEDITACPGTDTCKLGIASSRGLAEELTVRLRQHKHDRPPDVQQLRIKASGCFNACGQHHVADIGFLGVSRNVRGRRVPHFQLVLGGEWKHNAGAYGLAIGAVPAKRVPEVVDAVTEHYLSERRDGETFHEFFQRAGRARTRALLQNLVAVPAYEDDPTYYTDWGDPREYTIGDLGVGECAGEVVSSTDFGLADSERGVFEAQLALDAEKPTEAAAQAYRAMLSAARALVRIEIPDISDDADTIVAQFRERFYETQKFFDPYAGGKFANYLLRTHKSPPNGVDAESARRTIGEAQLFIEAAHACYDRMSQAA